MYRSALFLSLILAATAGAQQQSSRRATFLGGGSPDRGKCTVEVVVDGAAEVAIRGDQATLRNLSGQPAQWRRFECTGPLPNNPAVRLRRSSFNGITLSATKGHTLFLNAPWTEHDYRDGVLRMPQLIHFNKS